jgi:1-deoxy-D-xylulose-5-phosphate synthase
VAQFLAREALLDGPLKFRMMGLPDRFIDQASPEDMYAAAGLTAADIRMKVVEALLPDRKVTPLRA